MDSHRIALQWARAGAAFARGDYPKRHELAFSGGQRLRANAAPGYGGDPLDADPEQQLLGALASCHLLTFLAVAANRGHVVDSYEDDADCVLGKTADGRTAVTLATLRPRVVFAGENAPDAAQLAQLHERAHRACFIGNTLNCEVRIEPR